MSALISAIGSITNAFLPWQTVAATITILKDGARRGELDLVADADNFCEFADRVNRYGYLHMPAAIVCNPYTGALMRLLKRDPAEQCAFHRYPDLASGNITVEEAITEAGLSDCKLIPGSCLLGSDYERGKLYNCGRAAYFCNCKDNRWVDVYEPLRSRIS